MAAHPYHSSPHVNATLQCGSCIRNAKEENTRGNKPVRDSLETVIGKRDAALSTCSGFSPSGTPLRAVAPGLEGLGLKIQRAFRLFN